MIALLLGRMVEVVVVPGSAVDVIASRSAFVLVFPLSSVGFPGESGVGDEVSAALSVEISHSCNMPEHLVVGTAHSALEVRLRGTKSFQNQEKKRNHGSVTTYEGEREARRREDGLREGSGDETRLRHDASWHAGSLHRRCCTKAAKLLSFSLFTSAEG